MLKISLIDSEFAHIPFNHEGYDRNKYFEYDRMNLNHDIIVFSEKHYTDVTKFNNKIKIAYCAESPVIRPEQHEWLINNINKFDYIWTYNKKILDLTDKAKFMPNGGSWCFENQRKVYPKNKNVSIVASNKASVPGHIFRHNLIKELGENIDFIAGSGYHYLQNKLDAFYDYRFQIVVDNCNEPYFFTDKICDCFATGTIPITWSGSWIFKFFNKEGMFTFSNINELSVILNNIRKNGPEIYNSMMQGIIDNFEKVKEYVVPEDFIWRTFLSKII